MGDKWHNADFIPIFYPDLYYVLYWILGKYKYEELAVNPETPETCCKINYILIIHRDDSRLAPSQWETSLQSNTVSHWLGAKVELSVLMLKFVNGDVINSIKNVFSINNEMHYHFKRQSNRLHVHKCNNDNYKDKCSF